MISILISKLHRKFHKTKTKTLLLGVAVLFIILILIYYTISTSSSSGEILIIAPTNFNLTQKYFEKRDTILCYVPLLREKLTLAKLIKETWGSKCDELVFYGNFGMGSLPEKYQNLNLNIENVNVTEKYELLWGKTKATLGHLYNKYGNKFDWFLKADDDTFVIIENLRRFIHTLDAYEAHNLPLWFGYKMKHKKMKHGYMSGSGYAMNAKALSKFATFIEVHNHKDVVQYDPSEMTDTSSVGCKTATNVGIEDLELGRCFHFLKIGDVPTHDSLGRHRFLPLSLSTMISGNVHSGHWIWFQSWYPFKLGRQCCSPFLITMHEVSSVQHKILNFLLNELQIHNRR